MGDFESHPPQPDQGGVFLHLRRRRGGGGGPAGEKYLRPGPAGCDAAGGGRLRADGVHPAAGDPCDLPDGQGGPLRPGEGPAPGGGGLYHQAL